MGKNEKRKLNKNNKEMNEKREMSTLYRGQASKTSNDFFGQLAIDTRLEGINT